MLCACKAQVGDLVFSGMRIGGGGVMGKLTLEVCLPNQFRSSSG